MRELPSWRERGLLDCLKGQIMPVENGRLAKFQKKKGEARNTAPSGPTKSLKLSMPY